MEGSSADSGLPVGTGFALDEPVRVLFLIFLIPLSASAGDLPPVRLGVNIYNSVGSNQRLIAFMKIGASRNDLRYLSFLNARLANRPVTRAFLAGQLIYFKGLEQPLKVIDLKQKVFSFNGKRIDLRQKGSLEQRMAQLEKIVFPRRAAFLLWDWFFPFAYAASTDPETLAPLAGILAVSGVTSSTHCLNEREDLNCANQFMGTLAAVGAVGGLRGNNHAASVFCSPDFRGGQRFVIGGEERTVLSVSERNGDFEVSPSHLGAGTRVSDNAAGELLSACRSQAALADMNVALAYPATAAGMTTQTAAVRRPVPAAVPIQRAPAAYVEEEQGGAAR